MIFCTISEPFAPSITSVSCVAGARSSTASSRIGVLRAVDDVGPLHQFVQIRRLEIRTVPAQPCAIYLVQERKFGSYIFRPLVSLRKCSASSGVRNAL